MCAAADRDGERLEDAPVNLHGAVLFAHFNW